MKKIMFLMCLILFPAIAFAQGSAPPSSDDQISALIQFLENGASLPAIGAGLVILVSAARAWLSKKVPWFSSKFGGYTLAYGAACILYLGGALEQGAHINGKLIWMMLTAGLTTSGVLDHWRDLLGAAKQSAVKVGVVALAMILATQSMACARAKQVTLLTGQCVLDSGVEIILLADLAQQNYAQLVQDAMIKFTPDLVMCALQAIASTSAPTPAPVAARRKAAPFDVVRARAQEMLRVHGGAR